jgi:predicted RNA-binding protein with RPS1 domain/nucleoid DNA-binding protein
MGDDPWMGVNRRYPQGTRMFGKITNIADYGAFVELEPGIEGLVHVSEMDWTNKNVAPEPRSSPGRRSRSHGPGNRRRQAPHQPGHEAVQGQPVARVRAEHQARRPRQGPDQVDHRLRRVRRLAAGIDGLVHLSDLSWNETGEAAVRNYKKGQEVEAIVLAVDVDRERISLGIKQLDSDPFTTFVSVNDKGQVVTGKVKTVDAKGAEIDLGEDIIGYLRASEISRDRVEDARNVLKEGDEVTAVVVNVDRKTRNIQLSIKAKDMADQQEAMANLSQQSAAKTPARPAWAPCCAPSWTTTTEALVDVPAEQTTGRRRLHPVVFLFIRFFMTRSDLVEELAARFSQLTHRDAEFAVKAILDAMNDALVRRAPHRDPRLWQLFDQPPPAAHGRNPRSGESVAIPEKRVPHFKPGKALREAVDQRTAELQASRQTGL